MDVQTGLVYVAVVVISALVIGFVSVFAMKEKSYEEAIAEQRKLPDDLLLGKKEKGKEKKHKNKTGKKVKEKKEEKEEKEEKPEHVQFEETPQIMPPEPPAQESGKGSKKKGKVDKVKPILVNRDEPVVVVTEPTPLQSVPSQEINHFDITQPKDDLELIRSHSRENLHQINQSEPVVNKSPKETPTKSKKNSKDKDSKKKDEQKEEKKEDVVVVNQQPNKTESIKEVKEKSKESAKEPKEPKEAIKETVTPVQSANPPKESKKIKKKNDILAQIGGDKDGVNFSLLNPLIQKAELSRTEIQYLIDQLLNKQQDNPQEHAEWTESRADPVMKLRKQLADKEKALKDEQEAGVSVQNKLVELRTELNAERSRLRQLEEALAAKVAEAATLHTRMQHILESHAAEKQGFSRQIEQLQAKVTEDAAIIAKMQEDQGQSHGQMQQELIAQRKQLEVQFAQMRDNENALKAQLAQKHVEFQELQNVNVTMSQELQATCESSTHEIEMLRQQITIMQEQIMHSEGQLQHYKEASDRLQDMHRQLEESRRAQSDMDHRIKSMHRHEQELQKQVNWLQSELDTAKAQTVEVVALKEQLDKLKSDSPDSATTDNGSTEASEIAAQLKLKEQELQKALAELESVQKDQKKLEAELMDAKNQLKSTKSELARAQDNYKLSQNDLKKCQEELREIQKILAQTRSEVSKLNNPGTGNKSGDADLQIMKLQEENERLSLQVGSFSDLQKEMKQLREKNESLSTELAASAQRPAVEGRENGIENEKIQKNNVQLVESTNLLAQKENQLTELKTALTQREKELDQLGSQVETLRSEVNNQRSLASRLQDDLEEQRSKNNDLRRKNWKVMEALNSTQSHNKNSTGGNDDGQKSKLQEQEATKALLQRIFPEIKVSEKSHDQWMKVFEEQVSAVLDKIKSESKSDDAGSELEKTNKNLQAMVNHYKQIIYDTEGMLNKLQSHIESEEKRWQVQLRQKENEVSNLRIEIHELQKKTTTSNDELQHKITELETRLSEAESLKRRENSGSQTLHSAHSQKRTPDLAVLEQLQEEKARLSQQLQNESGKLSALDSEVAKLRLLVESSGHSLITERKLVSQLQQEISQLKSDVSGGSSSSDQSTLNGPPVTDSSKSEPTLGAQCLIAALEKTLLKKTELENCSLTETDESVKLRQDIDDSTLTSNIASDTCHTTDNVIQNNCNPLNGQQHKKHKKKRKGGSGKK